MNIYFLNQDRREKILLNAWNNWQEVCQKYFEKLTEGIFVLGEQDRGIMLHSKTVTGMQGWCWVRLPNAPWKLPSVPWAPVPRDAGASLLMWGYISEVAAIVYRVGTPKFNGKPVPDSFIVYISNFFGNFLPITNTRQLLLSFFFFFELGNFYFPINRSSKAVVWNRSPSDCRNLGKNGNFFTDSDYCPSTFLP